MRCRASEARRRAASAAGAALLALGGEVRADPPELRLDGLAAWELHAYPRSPPAQEGTSVAWYANDARGEYAAVREDDQAYATHRNQVLLQPRLVGRWNDAGGVAEVQFRYDFADPSRARVLLKDVYASLRVGGFYAAAGNQSPRWGRMDVFSPIDVLSPRDYDDPFLPEPLAAPAIQVRYSLPFLSVQGVLLPGFVPSRYPAFAPARYDVLIPQPRTIHQPGGTTEIDTVYQAMAEPALTPTDDPDPDDGIEPLEAQVGVRAELSLPHGDVAVSAYYGRDHLPTYFTYDILNAEGIDDFALISQGQADVALTPWHGHVSVFGVDGDVVVGPVVLKGEATYTMTSDPDGGDCAIDDPYLRWSAGAEVVKEGLPGGMGLAVRVEATGDHELPLSADGVRNTEGLCLEDGVFPDVMLYDPKHVHAFAVGGQVAWTIAPSLVLDVRGYANRERDWMVRGELRYTFQDKVRLAAAGMAVGGHEDGVAEGRPGYFWWYRDNDRVELSVAYLF